MNKMYRVYLQKQEGYRDLSGRDIVGDFIPGKWQRVGAGGGTIATTETDRDEFRKLWPDYEPPSSKTINSHIIVRSLTWIPRKRALLEDPRVDRIEPFSEKPRHYQGQRKSTYPAVCLA